MVPESRAKYKFLLKGVSLEWLENKEGRVDGLQVAQ